MREAAALVEYLRANLERVQREIEAADPYLDRSDGPAGWNGRQIISHLIASEGLIPQAIGHALSLDDPEMRFNPGAISWREEYEGKPAAWLAERLVEAREFAIERIRPLSDDDLEELVHLPTIGLPFVPLDQFIRGVIDNHVGDHLLQLRRLREQPPA